MLDVLVNVYSDDVVANLRWWQLLASGICLTCTIDEVHVLTVFHLVETYCCNSEKTAFLLDSTAQSS
jgi:hypothetical protein